MPEISQKSVKNALQNVRKCSPNIKTEHRTYRTCVRPPKTEHRTPRTPQKRPNTEHRTLFDPTLALSDKNCEIHLKIQNKNTQSILFAVKF